MAHKVCLIRGDGIGPEIAEATRRCLDAAVKTTRGAKGIEWTTAEAGVDIMETAGTPLPEETIAAIKAADACIKAPITTPVGTGFRSVNVHLRQSLGLYACLRPCKSYPGVRSRYEDIDLVIVRENTEDLYAGVEFQKGTDEAGKLYDLINALSKGKKIVSTRATTGISIKPISVEGTERIVKFAFDYARANGRKKVTSVHKANIMKFTDGLWLEVSRQVAAKYPDIEFEDRIVDNMCMQLGAEARAVRCDRAAQSVRRHPLRPVRRPGGRARDGPGRQYRRRRRDLRGHARLSAEVQRAKQGQPGGADPLGDADAAAHQREHGRRAAGKGRGHRDRRGQGCHLRHEAAAG